MPVFITTVSGRNVALQADPSVIYAELLDGSYGGALHHQDMTFQSGYNTYLHTGLPPGPIGNPGRTSLEAAMHPAKSEYLYFVSDGSGHHRFSSSLEEHNQNVARLRQAMQGSNELIFRSAARVLIGYPQILSQPPEFAYTEF